MRLFACAILLPLLLLTQAPKSPTTFPIPADMQEIWPGAKLNDTDTRLLRKAMAPDLNEQSDESQPNDKYTFDKVDSVAVELGTLGKGVIVLMSGSTWCGTGGCPICLYVREKAAYRKVLNSSGWAFAVVVSSHATVPDLVVAGNAGGPQIVLTLYRYAGSAFSDQGCETLTSKDGNAPGSWWDPSHVNIEPCSWK